MSLVASEQHNGPDGASEGVFAGHAVLFDCSGALFFPERALLVVSDLHLERGAAHARRGMFLPPYDTARTLDALAAVIGRFRPRQVISLGDSFHDRVGAAAMPAPARQRISALASDCDWIWITGNHDPDGVSDLPGRIFGTWTSEGLHFRHEPSDAPVPGEICGHLHPSATLRRPGKSVRRPCFVQDDDRLMLPAFATMRGGLDLRHAAFAGLFRRQAMQVHMLGEGRVFSLPFAAL